jgi:hypothetical protein
MSAVQDAEGHLFRAQTCLLAILRSVGKSSDLQVKSDTNAEQANGVWESSRSVMKR